MTPTETAAPAPPISPDLWARVRRLDPYCEIVFVRTNPQSRSPWAGRSRVWMVTVRPYSRVAFEMVQGEHPTLAVALAEVVAEAERRGWGATTERGRDQSANG